MRVRRERNHIQLPSRSALRPPPGLLRALRRVDATIDCHYLGDGRWVVGSVRPTMKRRELAAGMMDRGEAKNPMKAQFAMLAYHGFAPMAAYEIRGRHFGRVVNDIRERDHRWRTNPDEAFAQQFAHSSRRLDGRSDEQFMEDVETAIHEWYPYLFKGRKHF